MLKEAALSAAVQPSVRSGCASEEILLETGILSLLLYVRSLAWKNKSCQSSPAKSGRYTFLALKLPA